MARERNDRKVLLLLLLLLLLFLGWWFLIRVPDDGDKATGLAVKLVTKDGTSFEYPDGFFTKKGLFSTILGVRDCTVVDDCLPYCGGDAGCESAATCYRSKCSLEGITALGFTTTVVNTGTRELEATFDTAFDNTEGVTGRFNAAYASSIGTKKTLPNLWDEATFISEDVTPLDVYECTDVDARKLSKDTIGATILNEGSPSTSYGNRPSNLHVEDLAGTRTLALFKFDLSDIPAAATINEVRLSIRSRDSKTSARFITYRISPFGENWDVDTVNYNTKPGISATLRSALYNIVSGNRIDIIAGPTGGFDSYVKDHFGEDVSFYLETTDDDQYDFEYPELYVDYTSEGARQPITFSVKVSGRDLDTSTDLPSQIATTDLTICEDDTALGSFTVTLDKTSSPPLP